jgi:hypothetical protein
VTWFDDSFPSHPKTRSIPRATRMRTIGVWMACGTWSAKHLTDGVIAGDVVEDEGGKRADAQALVNAGLWHGPRHNCDRCVDPPIGSYVFHDWKEYQPVRSKVLAERRATADRVARHRERNNGASNGVTGGVSNDAPGPARPDPVKNYLQTLLSRLAAGDAYAGPPPAEVIDSWQEIAGEGVDLEEQAAAYFARFGDRAPREERGAWLGWLRKAGPLEAARHAAAQVDPDADVRPPTGCGQADCEAGYIGFDEHERPIPCSICRPHLRAVEAS